MLFKKPTNGKKELEPTTWAKGATSYLERHLRKAGLLHAPPNMRKWGLEFDKLSGIQTNTAIRKVLTWYCKNLHSKFIPQAYSAVSFCAKFSRLQNACRQGVSDNNTCPEAIEIFDRLGLHWPNDCTPKHEVLQLLHNTYVGYSKFTVELRECKPATDRGVRLLTYLQETLPPATAFTGQWLVDIHDYAHSNLIVEWHGLNSGYTWHLRHWRFRVFGEGLVKAYCGEPERWEDIIAMVEGGDDTGS